jgi:hypothetical protein
LIAKTELFESSLHRASEAIGDLTAPALERFYARFPEAERAFEAHGHGRRARLEAQMVETALFCLMRWLEEPHEIVSLLTSSVPHHRLTLLVELPLYEGLVAAVLDTIVATIPATATAELDVCSEVRLRLLHAVGEAG